MNNILLDDLEIISKCDICFEKYKNKFFLITGGTGLIGSLLIKTLLYCDIKYNLNIKICVVVRDKKRAMEILSEYDTYKKIDYYIADLEKDDIKIEEKIDYIIHAASPTRSRYIIQHPVEVFDAMVLGTKKMLDIAVTNKVETFIYISSMEMYGQVECRGKIDEEKIGYLDLKNPRSCYPQGKRTCECLCHSYMSEYGVNIKIARLAQTFGAGILDNEDRVFAQFAKSAINNENIILHTDGSSEGNYVYTRDAVVGILYLLTKGKIGEAYNISNEQCHCSIKEMAELVAGSICNDDIEVIIDIPEDSKSLGYAPNVKMWLDAEKMRRIGWKPEVGMIEAYNRMIQWIEFQKANKKECS